MTDEYENEDELTQILRRQQQRLQLREVNDLLHLNRETLGDLNTTHFQDLRTKANEIGKKTTHVREMQLDAINLKDLSMAVNTQATKLEDFSIKFDFPSFAAAIVSSFSDENGNFSWERLGADVAVLFRNVPAIE